MKLMSQNTKNNLGFTLIELLVAIAILGGISVLNVRLLWDTLATKTKQNSIESSSESFRFLVSTISEAIQSSQSIIITSPSLITIKGTPCRIIRLNGTIAEQATDNTACSPSVFKPMNQPEISLQKLQFIASGTPPQAVNIIIQGNYKDNLGIGHSFNYSTKVAARTIL